MDHEALVRVLLGRTQRVLGDGLGEHSSVLLVPALLTPDIDNIVKPCIDGFAVLVELGVRRHVDGITEVPSVDGRPQELDRRGASRPAAFEPTGEPRPAGEQVVPTRIEDQEVVPVLFEEVSAIGVVSAASEPTVIEAVDLAEKEAGIVDGSA
jgi:hypothetical protein